MNLTPFFDVIIRDDNVYEIRNIKLKDGRVVSAKSTEYSRYPPMD